MTTGLSIDPMAYKYPSISPYAYCAWNPIKLIDPDGREIDDYYNLKGKLIKHTDEGNNKYLVLTFGDEVSNDLVIVVPTEATLYKMERIYDYNIYQKEKGLVVEINGNSSSIVTGEKDIITKEQWQPAIEEIKKRNGTVDFLVHLHIADFQQLEIGAPDPSVQDRSSGNFYNSKLGVILSFVQDYNPNRQGKSKDERDYTRTISFYNETSETAIFTMSFRNYKKLINRINNSR